MRTETPDTGRPPIILVEAEAESLADLAVAAEQRSPVASRMLLEEINRAQTCEQGALPSDVVTMGSTVTFVDEASGATHELRLVYPHEAEAEQKRISILTPVGAGLIGLRSGQSISWPNLAGQHRSLRIVGVTQPSGPES